MSWEGRARQTLTAGQSCVVKIDPEGGMHDINWHELNIASFLGKGGDD